MFQTPSFRGGSKHGQGVADAGYSYRRFKPLHFGADLSTPRSRLRFSLKIKRVSNPFISGRI